MLKISLTMFVPMARSVTFFFVSRHRFAHVPNLLQAGLGWTKYAIASQIAYLRNTLAAVDTARLIFGIWLLKLITAIP